jgi:hypothetical protein
MWHVRRQNVSLLALTLRAFSFRPHCVGLPVCCGNEVVTLPKDSVFYVLSLDGGQAIRLALRPLISDFKSGSVNVISIAAVGNLQQTQHSKVITL